MIVLYPNEIFKEVELPHKLTKNYAVSNYGRFISFENDLNEGRLLNCSYTNGYKLFRYKIQKNNVISNKHVFIYKLVANAFLEKPTEAHTEIIHLDYQSNNDHVSNLKWVTPQEKKEHYENSPNVKIARLNLIEYNKKRDGKKLTSTQVIRLKRELANPSRKTRLKIIAKRFNISEMQLYRIKKGENWSHIEI